MESLPEKLFGFFAFNNKRTLLLSALIVFLLVLFAPVVLDFFFGNAQATKQIELVQKINGIEKAKLKDKRLLESYESVLNRIGERAKDPIRLVVKEIKIKSFKEIFKIGNPAFFAAGALLWFILGIVGMLSNHPNLREKIVVLVIMILLGLLSGWFADRMTAVEPAIIMVLGIPILEALLFSMIGTLQIGRAHV